jgi:hypothetical protein
VRRPSAEVGGSRMQRIELFNICCFWACCRGRGHRHTQTIMKDHTNLDEIQQHFLTAVVNVDNETLPAQSLSLG